MLPLLALATRAEEGRSDLQSYTELMLELCTTVAHTANSPEMRSACFQILVSGLDGESPPLVLLDRLVETGRLPMNELAAGAGVEKKTMERHRKYLVAILLAFTNGYEIIRGHLCQIGTRKGGDAR